MYFISVCLYVCINIHPKKPFKRLAKLSCEFCAGRADGPNSIPLCSYLFRFTLPVEFSFSCLHVKLQGVIWLSDVSVSIANKDYF